MPVTRSTVKAEVKCESLTLAVDRLAACRPRALRARPLIVGRSNIYPPMSCYLFAKMG
jgi:hypothetical protein